jgi:hypothetical protein
MQNRGMRAVSLGEHPETSPLNLDNLMDLSTSYLGMNLRPPLVPSASPLSRNIDDVKRLEDAGAPAVVFHSIFEEQLQASSKTADLRMGPELYLDHISRAKDNVSIPIIGSLNAAAPGGWVAMPDRLSKRAPTRWNSTFTIFLRTWIAAAARSSRFALTFSKL